MAKLIVAAEVINEIYYNGRILSGDLKLDKDDFLQALIISAGGILRNQFYEQIQLDGSPGTFLSSMLDFRKVKVTRHKNGTKVADLEIMNLPRNMGVFAVYPVATDCEGEEPDTERPFLRILPGEDRFYPKSVREDTGINTFTQRGLNPALGTEETEVFVEGIFNDEIDVIEFPEGVVRAAFAEVLNTVLKADKPVDPTNDRDPNIKQLTDKLR